MARVLTLAIFLLFLLAASPGAARAWSSILILQSSPLAPYEEAREQATRVLWDAPPSSGPKSISPPTVEFVLLSQESPESLRMRLASSPPSVILAIGSPAVDFSASITDVPVVFVMTPGADAFLARHPFMTGVLIEIPPKVHLAVMKSLFPGKPPLLLFDSNQNGKFAQVAAEAAKKSGISLVTLSAAAPRDVPRLLSVLAENAGLFWMIPDTTVVTPDNIEQIVATSLSRRVPIVTFAEKYLSRGAAMAITTSPASMGAQAAKIALRLVQEKSPTPGAPVGPDHIHIICNNSIMEKTGAQIPDSLPPEFSADTSEVRFELVCQR